MPLKERDMFTLISLCMRNILYEKYILCTLYFIHTLYFILCMRNMTLYEKYITEICEG